MTLAEAMVGGTFGRLTVAALERRGRKLVARCRCACGREAFAEPNHLRSGRRVSCGCAMGGDRRSARAKR